MKVLYNRVNSISVFERADGSRVRMGPRDSADDHVVIEDHEANDLADVVALLRTRKATLMTLEQSRQFENQRGRKAPEAPTEVAPAPPPKAEPKVEAPPPPPPEPPKEEVLEDATDETEDDSSDESSGTKGRRRKKSRS